MPPQLPWEWLGRLPYGEALERQRARRDAVVAGRASSVLWLLEHDPVVTEGRRVAPGTPPPEALARRGIAWHRVERGGLATYHGPGQLVGYLILAVDAFGLTVRTTVAALEQGLMDWLATQGVAAGRRDGHPGVWVGRDKIAAIGLHFHQGVSMHGFALNLTVDLAPYGLIVPCGIKDGGVTSLAGLGPAPGPEAAAPGVARAVTAAILRRGEPACPAGPVPI